jgi:Methyl-accepting chemotaxis protein (MCP) signalling domain/PAS fold
MNDDLDFLRSVSDRLNGFLYRAGGPNEQFRMQHITAGIEQLTGYTAAEFLPGGSRDFSSINLDHDQIARQVTDGRYFDTGKSWDVHYRIRHRDGTILSVHEVGCAVLDEQGAIRHLEGAVIDASELAIAQQRGESWKDSLLAISDHAARITRVLSHLHMLALNARIEAARAGDQGLGFAVVANEMKSIALQAQELVSLIDKERSSVQTQMAA